MQASPSKMARLTEGEDAVPVVLHVGDDPFIDCCGIEGFVEATEGCVPVVGVFAYRIGMMDKQAEAGASRDRRPLQHFEIAVGIAECRDRARPMNSLMPTGLPALSSMKLSSGKRKSSGF